MSSDSFVCLKDETNGCYTCLCKNSDRHPNEVHEVVIIPELKIDNETIIDCTFCSVTPPKSHAHRILLCKPLWCWGAEMGSNSAGISISTQATYSSKNENDSNNAYLIGMDLVRLALMFGDNALDAVKVIEHYLNNYQQSGAMQWLHSNHNQYDSSFMVCDYNEVWIIETVNQYFVAKKYNDGIHSISNKFTLSAPFDMVSSKLRQHCDDNDIDWKYDLNMYSHFGKWMGSYFSDSSNRKNYIENTLNSIAIKRKLKINDFADILRSHKIRNNHIDNGILSVDICSHSGYGPIRRYQTTGSMMSIIRRDGTIITFVTGTSSPCISLYKPIYIGCEIPTEFANKSINYCNANVVALNKTAKQNAQRVTTYDSVLKNKKNIKSTANLLYYHEKHMSDQKNQNKQLWWKHEVFHRMFLTRCLHNRTLNEFIETNISEFEQPMFAELIEDYTDFEHLHSVELEMVESQQKIMDQYWKKANNILDKMIDKTNKEIDSSNHENNTGFSSSFKIKQLFNKIIIIFDFIWNLTNYFHRYLYHLKWKYYNALAGIGIKKNGKIAKFKKDDSLIMRLMNSLNSSNMIYRWIKLLLTSFWAVVIAVVGYTYFN